MSKYDWVLTVGDMNIHVCCPIGPLAKDFLSLIDAFKLTQLVNGPTPAPGHTLDLVLSHGVPVTKVEILFFLIMRRFYLTSPYLVTSASVHRDV